MIKIDKFHLKIYLLTHKLKPSISGYTLLESLLALVVVGILITSVAPMLALTTASRVQARRVDQATQALRAYVDGVRGGTLPPPQRFVLSATPGNNSNLANFKAPNFGFPPSDPLIVKYTDKSNPLKQPDPGTLIDNTGSGFNTLDAQNLVILAIRPIATCGDAIGSLCDISNAAGQTAEVAAAKKEGFFMHIRVYRADAFQGINVPTKTEQSNTFIGSIGSRDNPLVTSIVQIFPSGSQADTKYSDLTARSNRDFAAFGKF
jgi:prepilin-type N-terminal cleavage/methylation domain-containing protein